MARRVILLQRKSSVAIGCKADIRQINRACWPDVRPPWQSGDRGSLSPRWRMLDPSSSPSASALVSNILRL